MRIADDPCDTSIGPARELCRDGGGSGGNGGGGGGTTPVDGGPADPLTELARSTGKAAAWVVRRLGEAIDSPASVDLTSGSFLRQYAVVFAASTILVLVLWLLAVAKRAVRGVPAREAIGEAIGLLWVTVLTCAFMPLILHTVIGATHAVTRVLMVGMSSSPAGLFDQMADDLTRGHMGGGPLMWMVVSLATIVLCGLLYLIQVLRALAIYTGAVLGVVVSSALVSRDWWGHVRRWAGLMIMIILVEPAMVILLGLSSTLRSADHPVIVGLVATALSVGVAVMLVWKVPGWGDAVRMARATARGAGGAAGLVVGGGTASAGVLQGIHAHGGRAAAASAAQRANSGGGGGGSSAGGGVSGGMGAHAQRTPRKSGGSGGPQRPADSSGDSTK